MGNAPPYPKAVGPEHKKCLATIYNLPNLTLLHGVLVRFLGDIMSAMEKLADREVGTFHHPNAMFSLPNNSIP